MEFVPMEKATPPMPRSKLLMHFMLMSVSVSLSVGACVTSIALATSQFGLRIGSYSSGILYLTFCLSSLLFSNFAIVRFGVKGALIRGLALNGCYVLSFAVALLLPGAELGAVALMIGAALGGLGLGLLWPAQGVYYSSSAEMMANSGNGATSAQLMNAQLGSYFAATFLGIEVFLKLLSSVLMSMSQGSVAFGVVYVCISCAAVLICCFISPIGEAPCTDKQLDLKDESILAPFRLFQSDHRTALLFTYNAAFSVATTFLNSCVNGIVGHAMGDDSIGVLTAILVATAAALSLPYGRLGAQFGSQLPMLLCGAVSFALFGAAFMVIPLDCMGQWHVILPLYLIYASGRSTYETNFRATFADTFPHAKNAAFANLKLGHGLTAGLASFLLPNIAMHTAASLCTFVSAISVGALVVAEVSSNLSDNDCKGCIALRKHIEPGYGTAF